MSAQRPAQLFWEWPGFARGYIGFHVAALPHARDHRADVRIAQNESQGHFRHRHVHWHNRLQRFGVLDAADEVLRHEITLAPVTLSHELSLVSVPASEPSSNGTRAMIATSCSTQAGKSSSSG